MNIDILTLFPEMVRGFFTNSIMARAVKSGLVSYNIVDWRQYAEDKHHKCDDSPFGGGAGMVIKPEPLFKALDRIDAMNKRVVYASPSGKRLTQDYARQLSRESELVFICGHYEGIDQRIIDRYVDDEICIGDYVISSGEVATLVIIDAVYRLIDGVITDSSLDVSVLLIALRLLPDEGLAALTALLALVPYYGVLYLLRDKIQQKMAFSIE